LTSRLKDHPEESMEFTIWTTGNLSCGCCQRPPRSLPWCWRRWQRPWS